MIGAFGNESRSAQTDEEKEQKRYRLALSPKQVFLSGIGLVTALSWMFTLGVLVGRGVPMVSSKDFSPKAEFMRFLGLGREVLPPPDDVAATWDDSKKIVEALNYYEELTQKGAALPALPAGQPAKPLTPLLPQKAPGTEASGQTPPPGETQNPPQPQGQVSTPPQGKDSPPAPGHKAKAAPGQDHTPAHEAGKPKSQKSPPDAVPRDAGEHFTLLIASLRDAAQAQRLVEELRAKGHSARLQALNLNDGGSWTRVLVGNFRTRDEALRFSADFNRKENMEGLVVREVH